MPNKQPRMRRDPKLQAEYRRLKEEYYLMVGDENWTDEGELEYTYKHGSPELIEQINWGAEHPDELC